MNHGQILRYPRLGSLSLMPLAHRPNLLPLQTLQRPINEPIIVSPCQFFTPPSSSDVQVPMYCPTPLLGGTTADLTSIYFTTWAFDSHFPNRHLHHHHSLSTTTDSAVPSIEFFTNAFIFFCSIYRHRPNANPANPLLLTTNKS